MWPNWILITNALPNCSALTTRSGKKKSPSTNSFSIRWEACCRKNCWNSAKDSSHVLSNKNSINPSGGRDLSQGRLFTLATQHVATFVGEVRHVVRMTRVLCCGNLRTAWLAANISSGFRDWDNRPPYRVSADRLRRQQR